MIPRLRPACWLLLAFCGASFGCRRDAASQNARTTAQPASSPSPRDDTPAVTTAAWFVDVAQSAGIRFVPRNGQEAGHCSILESLGVGVALFDYDGDGQLDLFVPGGGEFGPNHDIRGLRPALFRHAGDWHFTEVTGPAGLAEAQFYSHGAVVGDYDGDGFPDLLITGYHGLYLYHNQGDGTFTEVSHQAGLSHDTWSTSAAWGDLDGDGNLDLYLVNYVDWSFDNDPVCGSSRHQRDVCSPTQFNAVPHRFFLGNGDGTFRDASQEVGLVEGGKGLGVVAADVDLDGHLDFYVTNDTTPNLLYHNDGHGHLQEIGLISGTAFSDTATADGSMGVDLGDYNLDGLPDLWVANFEDQTFALYRNEGNCVFQHVSGLTGISRTRGLYVGFGTVFFDFDLDGDEDIFVATGHVMYDPKNSSTRQHPLLFENLAGKQFVNVASQAGPYTQDVHVGRGVAVGDLDDDGRPDLAVSHTNEPIALLRNESKTAGHWLRGRLIGTRSQRDAGGARVRVQTGDRSQIRQVKGGSSFLSSSDPRLMFGLRDARTVDVLEIAWPSGAKQTLRDVAVDQTVVVVEPAP